MSSGGLKMTVDISMMEAIRKALPGKADAAIRAAAEEVTNQVKLSMGGSTGKSYTRGGVTHVASAPGDPPNPDIGTLRGSIRGVPDGHLRYRITDGVEYGFLQEFGTETIAPRPFMTPVFEKWRQGLFANLLTGYLG